MVMVYRTTIVYILLTVLTVPGRSKLYASITFDGKYRWLDEDKFKRFYDCLCDGPSVNCSAKYSTFHSSDYVTEISNNGPQSNNIDTCKYYRCEDAVFDSTFVCTLTPTSSWNSQETYTYIKHTKVRCSFTQCVAVSKNRNVYINYNALSSVVRNCDATCVYFTTSTTRNATTTLPSTRNQTTAKPSTSTTSHTTPRITSAAATYTAGGYTNAEPNYTTHTIGIQTEATTAIINNTGSQRASTSDNQTDNSTRDAIIGVVVALIVVAVAVIVVVLIWRGKLRPQDKPTTVSHDYVNFPQTSLENGDTKVSFPSTQPLSSEYSNYPSETTLSPYAAVEHNNPQIMGRDTSNRCSKSTRDFVYSKAEPLEQDYYNVNTATEANTHKDERVNNTAELDYASIDNTLDETGDEAISVYSVATQDNYFSNNTSASSIDEGQISGAEVTGNIEYSMAGCPQSENDAIDPYESSDGYARLREEHTKIVNAYDALLPAHSNQNPIKQNANPPNEESLIHQDSPYTLAQSTVELTSTHGSSTYSLCKLPGNPDRVSHNTDDNNTYFVLERSDDIS